MGWLLLLLPGERMAESMLELLKDGEGTEQVVALRALGTQGHPDLLPAPLGLHSWCFQAWQPC